MKLARCVCLLVSIAAFVGCGDSGPTSTEMPRAVLAISVVQGGTGNVFQSTQVITLRETNGVGVRVSSIRVVRSGTVVVFNQDDIFGATGTNRVEARGQLTFEVFAVGGISEVNVDATDDNGHQVTSSWRP